MPGAVPVVEQVLGIRVVDRDDWIPQHAFLGHGAQPDDAGRRLLRTPDHPIQCILPLGVQDRDQICAVVHRNVRLVVQRRQNVAVIAVVVLALDGEHRNAMIAHQAGGYIVLRGKRVGSAEHHFGATIAQCDPKIRRFGGDVQAGRDADRLQGLVLDKFLADDLQHFHRLAGPLDALFAHIREFDVLDVAIHLCWCSRHASPLAAPQLY